MIMYQIEFNVYVTGIHTFAISDSTQHLSLLSCPVFCLLSFTASLFLHSSSMASHSVLINGSTPSPSVAQIKFCVHHDNDFFSAAHWQYISKRLQYVYLLKSLMFIVTHPLTQHFSSSGSIGEFAWNRLGYPGLPNYPLSGVGRQNLHGSCRFLTRLDLLLVQAVPPLPHLIVCDV